MMYFNLYTLNKKLKRREQQKKNRKHQLMFEVVRMRRAEAARKRELEQKKPPGYSKPGQKEWTDKVSKVRNRLTGKKREAKDRWNRFAGTSDAGARGR
jgi:hypothetical protein